MSESLLIIGSGGREHSLGYTLGKAVDEVYFAQGNAGTIEVGQNLDIPIRDMNAMARVARRLDALTIVGPDRPLSWGTVDYFERQGLRILGPTQEAARLESDNIFAAEFNQAEDIPQAEPLGFFDDFDDAVEFVLTHDPESYVLKANGLADGKGAILPKDPEQALEALHDIMVKKIFGESGSRVLFQERLEGPELSVFILADGESYIMLPSFRDHKRLEDNDEGPNTGGMSIIGPIDDIDPATQKIIEKQIINKALRGMAKRGTPYKGILYIGLILTADGPKVIEYNARFGDPECQGHMMVAKPKQLYGAIKEVTEGKLRTKKLDWRPGQVATLALTAAGYPDNPRKGDIIHGLDMKLPEGVVVFHGGTKRRGGHVVTDGGRVLHIASYAETLALARDKAYSVIGEHAIWFDGMHYRKDIAKNAK